jgi:hypothetical protein
MSSSPADRVGLSASIDCKVLERIRNIDGVPETMKAFWISKGQSPVFVVVKA